MIKACGMDSDGTYKSVFLGLSRNNTEKLHTGQPIRVRLRQDLHAELPDLTVVLMAGETEQDVVEDLRVLAPLEYQPARNTPDEKTGDHA